MRRFAAVATIATLIAGACSDSPQTGTPEASADDAGTRTEPGDADPGTETAPSWLVADAGGAATTHEVSARSYDLPAPNLGDEAQRRFATGDALFQQFFRPENGLGPDFNADSCTSCHVGNGRQATPIRQGYIGTGPVVHVSVAGASESEAPFELPGYGTRLQTYAVSGEQEAQVSVLWETIDGTYPDGTPYELRRPVVSVVGREGMLPVGAQLSLRIPPQVAGPGLLDLVDDADILAAADPDDADGDGISGEVAWVVDPAGDRRIGRHGWKAETVDLVHQTIGALAEDVGVGTAVSPVDGAVELSDDEVDAIAFYLETLAVPAGRDLDDPDVVRGAALFETVGCTSCHTPVQRTVSTRVPELDDISIVPFTDLLLHDLGPGLDDGRAVFTASGAEWRTAPLWGIGLLELVNGHLSLLHDGRARSVEEAILWHAGEAEAVTAAFVALDATDRAALIRFVESR